MHAQKQPLILTTMVQNKLANATAIPVELEH